MRFSQIADLRNHRPVNSSERIVATEAGARKALNSTYHVETTYQVRI